MLVLGIETSCDETALALVENGRLILANEVASSLRLHKKYGGVVPEIATRSHVEWINLVLDQALEKSRVSLKEIDLISVVYGPGLVGALLIGLSLAKSLSLALNKPLVGVNHLQAHLYAPLLSLSKNVFPFVGLVVSGGHTNLFYVRDFLRWESLGRTRDDAAGEAFDKVAKLLNLGYPGGAIIEKMARQGQPDKIKFPRAYLEEDSLDFSFSGLKTSVLHYLRDSELRTPNSELNNIAAGFQEAVVDILSAKAIAACRLKGARNFVLGGGVARNKRLREALTQAFHNYNIKLYFPPLDLCQDNAAMTAGLGYHLYQSGLRGDLNLEVQPNLI